MPWTECIDCGTEFYRKPDEWWKKRCFDCYKEYKSEYANYSYEGSLDSAALRKCQEIRGFLIDNIKFLIFACHPDRNPRHQEKATEVIKFLNEFRLIECSTQ